MKKILLSLALLLSFSYHITAVSAGKDSYRAASTIEQLFCDCGLNGLISINIFKKALEGYRKFGFEKPVMAICDFSKPSNKERFYIIDLQNKKLILKSLVAHGKNSGDLMATQFSNIPESLKSSLGFFRIGSTVMDPKHGLSLWLDGLQTGLNDNARMRGIIIHGADYVSEKFVKQYGYTGKSFGCPALPVSVIPTAVPFLKDGALLYICKE